MGNNELSPRLKKAVDFLKENGYAKNDREIAGKVGVLYSTFCQIKNGRRTPLWGTLLDFCDHYPINFWWLRTGEGSMITDKRELMLLRKIEELERRIKELEGE